MSTYFFYKCIYKCIDAIMMMKDLEYSLPETPEEIKHAAKDLESISLKKP